MVWRRNSTDDPHRFFFEWHCPHCGEHLQGTHEPPHKLFCQHCGKWATFEEAEAYLHRGPRWAPPSTVYT